MPRTRPAAKTAPLGLIQARANPNKTRKLRTSSPKTSAKVAEPLDYALHFGNVDCGLFFLHLSLLIFAMLMR